MTTPVYSAEGITIYHGRAEEILPSLGPVFASIVSDVPYGVAFSSNMGGKLGTGEIVGDNDTSLRDWLLAQYPDHPALIFGSPRVARPARTRHTLIWDKGEHTGMGDLSFPWKPDYEEIYIIGTGWRGARTSSVLSYNAPNRLAKGGEGHWHLMQKPVALMADLLRKCPPGPVLDPFMGSGSTLVAARMLGREAIGIEVEARHVASAITRLTRGHQTLLFGAGG